MGWEIVAADFDLALKCLFDFDEFIARVFTIDLWYLHMTIRRETV